MIVLKFLSRTCFCFALCFLLSACQPEIVISLASSSESIDAPRFMLRNSKDASKAPSYSTLRLYDVDDKVLWHIRAEPMSNDFGVEEITYGVVPEHFVTVIAAQALEANQEYALMAQGRGLGTLRFNVDADGILKKK